MFVFVVGVLKQIAVEGSISGLGGMGSFFRHRPAMAVGLESGLDWGRG